MSEKCRFWNIFSNIFRTFLKYHYRQQRGKNQHEFVHVTYKCIMHLHLFSLHILGIFDKADPDSDSELDL